MRSMTVPAGDTIFREGDPSVAVYVIEAGEVAISVGDPPHSIEVARLGPGDLFGESGVLEARPRAAKATAVIATSLLVTDADMFVHAFGMDNERALSLVRLLCARLRGSNQRVARPGTDAAAPPREAAIRILPADERLITLYGVRPVEVRYLPFQVGNRFGGEALPMSSNHGLCIPARGEINLSAPHFELLRRDGILGVRDLGSRTGTIVNGALLNRASVNPIQPMRRGANEVIAGKRACPFRFRVQVRDG
jgi:CRP/FNR family transcriptional regulator, cyclic AMP receptor protein